MQAITWKVSYEFTKFQATNAHLGQYALYLQAAILHTWHLVDKLTKQPCIGNFAHYQLCLPHPVKPNWINQYMRGERITTTMMEESLLITRYTTILFLFKWYSMLRVVDILARSIKFDCYVGTLQQLRRDNVRKRR
jgi:hypothetical protein